MQYKISLSEDGTYIRVQVFEPVTAKMLGELADKAIALARQHRILKHLVDVRQVSNVSSPVEQYQLAHEDAKQMALDPLSRIAVLVNPQDPSHDFMETVLQNAWYNCRLFADEKTALKWLLG